MAEDKKPKLTPVFKLLKTALKIWWKNLKKFVMIYVWAALLMLIPVAVIALISGLGLWGNLTQSIAYWVILIFFGFWALVAIIYFLIRAYLSMFLLIKNDFVGKEWDIYQESAKYFWSYLALGFLMTIIIMLCFFALIIPAIIASFFLMFACYAFIFEGRRDIDAIKRSYGLVKNYWWAVFGRVLFLGLVFWVFGLILSSPLSIAPQNGAFAAVWGGVIQAISLLVGPVSLLFTYLMFQDLVKIKK